MKLTLLGALLCPLVATAVAPKAADKYAPWIEPEFPFFSSSLDLRDVTPGATPMNITPRGLVLNLGSGAWACFDVDLLRVAAVWTGNGVTPEALGPLSYQESGNHKTLGGQTKLPKPDGALLLANGIYPGWQIGGRVSFDDPREPQPSAEEPGRGPLPEKVARFESVRIGERGVVLEYTVAGALVRETISASKHNGAPFVQRHFRLEPNAQPRSLVLGLKPAKAKVDGAAVLVSGAALVEHADAWIVRVPASAAETEFTVSLSHPAATPPAFTGSPGCATGAVLRWPQEITTHASLSTATEPYVVDEIPLPFDNPWRRNVRPTDIGFLADGTAALVTFDGDVWLARGLGEGPGAVRWKRFTSGLHEPMGLVVRGGEIFVFDRNGIWCLRDTDGNGEADAHELFSNVFPQTAETREFPNSLKLAPDGSFVIAKGGQQDTTISRHNGSVLRVAADGRSFSVLGTGFRQPYAGVNPRTGLVTASDQEGQYTPTTPLYLLKEPAEFHGFLSAKLPKEEYPAPIAEPLTWIPHQVNASAVSQVWLYGAKMGPLNDSLVHVGFNRPELFRVLITERASRPQAAIVSVMRDFDVPALNATVNPVDGCLYVTGFQVVGWGTSAKAVSALSRVRYTGGAVTLPCEIVPMDKGVLVRFDAPLDAKGATDRASYTMESWRYQRTWKYGSPHLKADGKPGQDWLTPSAAYLSQDRRSVFVALPGMKPVQQMRIGWGLAAPDGVKVEGNAYFTPYELVKFEPEKEGFGKIEIDLTPKPSLAPATAPASVEEGRRLYAFMGCVACHATDDTVQLKVGPSWKGLYGSKRSIFKGGTIEATDDYLRESILDPAAKILKGFEKIEAGMPIYSGVLNDAQVESLIMFIKTLQ